MLLPVPILQDEWGSPDAFTRWGNIPTAPPKSMAPLECPPSLRDLRVLVVNDEPDARDLMKQILEECEAESWRSARSAAALDVLRIV